MRETMKNIEDLIDTFENTGDNGEFFIGDYSNVEIAIYIRKQQEEIERLQSIIKEVREYAEEIIEFVGDVSWVEIPSEDYIKKWQDILEILDKVGDKE